MTPETLSKIYQVTLVHNANMSSMTTQDGIAVFGTAPGIEFALDGYVSMYEPTDRKFAAILSEEMQNVIEDEITEDWFVSQMRRALLNPIGTLNNYASIGNNISSFFGFPPGTVNVELDGYAAQVNITI